MLFNSLHFLFFFAFVTLAYFGLSLRGRWWLLLLASCYFYAAFIPAYLLILAVVILVDYVAARLIEPAQKPHRRWLLIASLIANVGILAFFKYYDFFNDNLNTFLGNVVGLQSRVPPLRQLMPGLMLPIGLSFHTFQSMSYTIEVYRGKQPAERNFWVYALYVLYYPQLVAGPIERPQNILGQLHRWQPYDWERVKSGLLLMAWGLFKKVAIADRLALVVDLAYADVPHANGPTLVVATIFYSFQIYCDFSGYSDIAIGASRVMGITLMENFRAPYLARSITDFWRRWHISLSTWFRDYIYIPLGGNRVSPLLAYRNTLIIFLISGLWHGADWKFLVWGGLHGIYLVVSQWLSRRRLARPVAEPQYARAGLPRQVLLVSWQMASTFGLVSLAWVFFRAKNVSEGWLIWQKMAVGFLRPNQPLSLALNPTECLISVGLIGVLLLKDRYVSNDLCLPNRSFWPMMVGLMVACYLLGVFTANQFIYFQF